MSFGWISKLRRYVLCDCFWSNTTSKIQSGNKRVESFLVACLDPGSIPGDSTLTKNLKFSFEVFGLLTRPIGLKINTIFINFSCVF